MLFVWVFQAGEGKHEAGLEGETGEWEGAEKIIPKYYLCGSKFKESNI